MEVHNISREEAELIVEQEELDLLCQKHKVGTKDFCRADLAYLNFGATLCAVRIGPNPEEFTYRLLAQFKAEIDAAKALIKKKAKLAA
jgi:hypothetical protein